MKKLILFALLLAPVLPAQVAISYYFDAHTGTLRLPESIVGDLPPANGALGRVFVITNALNSGSCSGGGTAASLCRSNGTSWVALGGSSASGTVTSVGLVGTANQITITGTSPITSSGSWTVSIPSSPVFAGTVTAPVLLGTAISTPAAPAAGLVKLYPKGSVWCSLDSASSESCIGGGGGGAPGGSVGQYQYNNTTFAGSDILSYDGTNRQNVFTHSNLNYTTQALTSPVGTVTAALAGAGAGNLSAGTYFYKFQCGYLNGTSDSWSQKNVTVVDPSTNGQILLSAIPACPSPGTEVKIFRTDAGWNFSLDYALIATISSGTATYTDNIPDSALQCGYGGLQSCISNAPIAVGAAAYQDGVRYFQVTPGPDSNPYSGFLGPMKNTMAVAVGGGSPLILSENDLNIWGGGHDAIRVGTFVGVQNYANALPCTNSGQCGVGVLNGFTSEVDNYGTAHEIDGFTSTVAQPPPEGPGGPTATKVNFIKAFDANIRLSVGTADNVTLYGATHLDTGATITNMYGINLPDITIGANNWAIKTGSGLVEFGDTMKAPTINVTGSSFTFDGKTCTIVAGAIACS